MLSGRQPRRPTLGTAYTPTVPRLWNQTVEAHRRAVQEAILDSTAALVAQQGLRGVTMSRIAEDAGIGRATLYTYFSDVDAILTAWHERQVACHLHRLAAVRDEAGDAHQRLRAVLEAYALISFEHHGSELARALHQGGHVARAQQHLHDFVRDLVAEGARTAVLRDDVAPEELATYCLHAIGAASTLRSEASVRRLVQVTLDGMLVRPPEQA
jgi:AcrR family transcriptional regulator